MNPYYPNNMTATDAAIILLDAEKTRMNIEQAMYVNHEAVHLALSFCTGRDTRYSLRRPFRKGRYVYATNAIIIARVPEWCAPWVTDADHKDRNTPNCDLLPWQPELYANPKTPWEKLPKPDVQVCDRCAETSKDEQVDSSVYELADFADPPQICKRCGMYTASEHGKDYKLGLSVFNARQCRKLATLGAEMYAPLSGNALDAWRWEIPDLKMVGLLMPVRGATNDQ